MKTLLLIVGLIITPEWKTVVEVSHEEYNSDEKHFLLMTDWILDSDSAYNYSEDGVHYEMLFILDRDSVFIWNDLDDSYVIRIKI